MLKPADENERLKRLYEYRILDTDPEQRFDDLTYLASYICQTPVAMINLIDSDRQWTKSIVGFPPPVVPRDISFCSHTILEKEFLIVEDMTRDERFSGNPLVTQEPFVRFYAGAPVFSYDGLALGSLCVLDREPRKLNDQQRQALAALARQVHDQMELRRNLFELKVVLDERTRYEMIHLANENYLKQILESSRDGILVEENEKIVYMNIGYARLYGCESQSELMGYHISELAAPHDLERLLEYGRKRARGEEAPTLYDFQIRSKTGHTIDLEASISTFNSGGNHYIVTFARDIMERKRNEREREKLIRELQDALSRIKTLSGLLPICANCKKIRDDKGYWNQIEHYIEKHSQAQMTHGICPDCAAKLYPEVYKE